MTAALLMVGTAAACSPTLNWREVRVEPTRLKALLPCKPDSAVRRLSGVAGRDVEMVAYGCEAGGATFAVLSADLGDPAHSDQALAQWNDATRANLRGQAVRSEPLVPPGAMPLRSSQRVSYKGQRSDGSIVYADSVFFAQGSRIFQAVAFTGRPASEELQPFADGLRLE